MRLTVPAAVVTASSFGPGMPAVHVPAFVHTPFDCTALDTPLTPTHPNNTTNAVASVNNLKLSASEPLNRLIVRRRIAPPHHTTRVWVCIIC